MNIKNNLNFCNPFRIIGKEIIKFLLKLLCFSRLNLPKNIEYDFLISTMAEETKNQEVQEVAGMATSSQPNVEKQQENPEKFLAEFNWHNYEEGIDPIDDEKLEEF